MQSVQLCDSQAYQAPEAAPELPPTDLWPDSLSALRNWVLPTTSADPGSGKWNKKLSTEQTGDAADQAGHLDLPGAAYGEGRGATGAGLLLYYILKRELSRSQQILERLTILSERKALSASMQGTL